MARAGVTLTIEGLDELIREFKELGEKTVLDTLHTANVRAAEEVRDTARQMAPFDTGELERSIHVLSATRGKQGVLATVGSELYYAMFIEYGTERMRNFYPFLRPAFDSHEASIIESYREALREAVKQHGG